MPRSAHPDIPTDVFEQGQLCLFRDSTEMRLTAWPVPRAVRRHGREGPWEPFLPDFRVVHPYRPRKPRGARRENGDQLAFDFFDQTIQPRPAEPLTPAQQRRRAFDQFRFSLPRPVAKVAEPFRTHQWPLLVLLRYDEAAIELAESNPALAFSLAQKLGADREMIETLRCSNLRQRDLLAVLGLPSSPRAVNLFRKISPASVNGDNWHSMLTVIRRELDEQKSPLYHLPSINSGVVEILLDPDASRAATHTLLEEVSRDLAENHRGRIVHIITSTLQMQDELRVKRHSTQFPNIRKLKETHAEVTEQYRRRIQQLIDANRHDTDIFRNPPLPGIAGKIEPLTSTEALVNEGEEQGNCVASYAVRVRQGNTFIYRVLHPERATLSIVRPSTFGDWKIGELEARYNTDVSPETEDYVEAWLDRHRNIL